MFMVLLLILCKCNYDSPKPALCLTEDALHIFFSFHFVIYNSIASPAADSNAIHIN